VEVPDVTNQSGDEATSDLEAAGLQATYDQEPDDPSNCTVTDQNPAAGEQVDDGSEVTLTCEANDTTPPRGPSGANGTYNCSDFDTQQQAQDYYDAQGGVSGGDPDGLDRDHDGTPCESLP
jgi:beta-lactam-binding protein with PASTA domain